MKLLLLSNSTNAGESYLSYPKKLIQMFLGEEPVQALFIPYAAVTFSFDEYERKVKERFQEIGHDIVSIHRYKNPVEAVLQAKAIVVGGGNTFQLLHLLQKNQIINIIREKVISRMPYIGWSAGSNITCPTICTTNDMPIVETEGLGAFNLVPFQINPHYTDDVPPAFSGETRDQRISEYLSANPIRTVVGLREGTMFLLDNKVLKLIGPHKAKIFKINETPYELGEKDDFSFLLNI